MEGKNGATKLKYRLSLARTYLKKAGYIDNSSRGVWAITELGNTITDYDIKLEVTGKSHNIVRDFRGAIPIDLIDGNDLATHLKELGLGVDVKLVEKVIIKESWFDNI